VVNKKPKISTEMKGEAARLGEKHGRMREKRAENINGIHNVAGGKVE